MFNEKLSQIIIKQGFATFIHDMEKFREACIFISQDIPCRLIH